MQPRSTACFSIEQGAKMHRLLMPARSTQAARDRLQSLMQSESSATRLIIRPPLIQLPLVIVCYCVLPIWACVNNQKISWGKKAGLMIEDDLKAQQPGKMWKGAGAVQPSVTPAPRQTLTTSRSHMAKRVLPGVTLLLLFCCCYLFTEAVRWDERGEGFCQGVAGGKGFFFLEMIWHSHGVQQSAGPALQTEGERGRAICGTDMVDVAHLVCFCLEWCQKVTALWLISSQPDPRLVTRLFTPIHGEKVHLYMSQYINPPKIRPIDQSPQSWNWYI